MNTRINRPRLPSRERGEGRGEGPGAFPATFQLAEPDDAAAFRLMGQQLFFSPLETAAGSAQTAPQARQWNRA